MHGNSEKRDENLRAGLGILVSLARLTFLGHPGIRKNRVLRSTGARGRRRTRVDR